MEIRNKVLGLYLLKDELNYFHESLNNEFNPIKKFRLIKQNLIVLNTFIESLNKFNLYLRNNDELKDKARSIRKRGGLINHMRNKIGGHLDEDILKRAAQWSPDFFSKKNKENKTAQIFIGYKTILESSINSYIDINDNKLQKEFGIEIDLMIPSDCEIFFNYLGCLNVDSINWISNIIEVLELDFEYFDDDELINNFRIASYTDFNLKKDFKLPELEEIEDNEMADLLIEAIKETDLLKKNEKLNDLILKLEQNNEMLKKELKNKSC
ncbi:hypothetical protein BTO06_09875 [Tenacibaculum sp. SZ-18]|uniref:hypothetical protein n=1 Tax=Tenacibaculum sp. SZ-18 TaxID=754423 RepID=UPI000C2D2C2A|nr:hypothetical protein [Tenacibaculum sp. SZ-18]AUC15428.1 hypothetical protein BTO06_09875 [Tenacibaculum sp. SZ-18]